MLIAFHCVEPNKNKNEKDNVEKHSVEDTKTVLIQDNKEAEQIEVGLLDTQSKELWDMFNTMQQNTEQLMKRVVKLEERKERVEGARYTAKSRNSEQEQCDRDSFRGRVVEADREATELWDMYDSIQLDAELLEGRVGRLEHKENANNNTEQGATDSDTDVFYSC